MWFKKNKPKKIKKDEITLNLTSWKELPGFAEPCIEDLKVEAIKFERTIRLYLEGKGKSLGKRVGLNEMMKILPNYPFHPEHTESWSESLKEYDNLRVCRNQLIHHRDCETLPPVKELYYRFKEANRLLRPWKICDPSSKRFGHRSWNANNELEFFIDDVQFNLRVEDISNITLQLDQHSRGKVNFEEGLMVVAKYHDYFYENLTVYVEGYPSFDLNIDETMMLSEYLGSLLGQRLHS
ncbi:hypothetical protein [Vibrio splendidus]|uniref:hypothetical protein n=1 Tax=Vibrio splendidus TaxID=29497 RepID=UPI0024694A58|nr:hypothetical protein [Vibrio splendidus]MDH6028020.1 hypothetical protein [Vibrio splendidus]